MNDSVPPLGFRIAVIVGGTALVLGIAGAVLLALEGDRGGGVLGAGAYPRIRLVGVPDGAEPAVDVRWRHAETDMMVPALPAEEEPDLWLLPPPIPAEGEVTLEVTNRATDPPRLMLRRVLGMDGPGETTVDLGASPGDDG